MAAINGTLCVLKFGTTLLTGQLDGTLGGSADMLDATTKDSTGKAKEYISGETEFHGTVTALYEHSATANLAKIVADISAGTQWTIKFGQTTTGGRYYTGTANIKSWNWAAPKNALSQISLEVQGSAVMTQATA
ncbi:MAG: phage tail tube protein [Dehalococcoidia bacterium]|jgi:TP901-1 family phage major tail protein